MTALALQCLQSDAWTVHQVPQLWRCSKLVHAGSLHCFCSRPLPPRCFAAVFLLAVAAASQPCHLFSSSHLETWHLEPSLVSLLQQAVLCHTPSGAMVQPPQALPPQACLYSSAAATKLCHIKYEDGSSADIMKLPKSDLSKYSLPGAMAVKRVDGVPTAFPAEGGHVAPEENMLKVCWDKGPIKVSAAAGSVLHTCAEGCHRRA